VLNRYEIRLSGRDFQFVTPGPPYLFAVEEVLPTGAAATFRVGERAIKSGSQVRAGETIIVESVGSIPVKTVVFSLDPWPEW
jgi:hypothetical protein